MYYDVTEYSTMTVIPAKAVCMTKCPNATIATGLSSASFVCNYAGPEGYASATVDEFETQYYDSLSATRCRPSRCRVRATPCLCRTRP